MRYLAAALFLPLYTAVLCALGIVLVELWFRAGIVLAALGSK